MTQKLTQNKDAKPTPDQAEFLYKQESYIIRGGAFEIYKQFRNSHKEKIYQRSLVEYLRSKGLIVDSEKQIPVYFQNKKVGTYIPDLIVENKIFIELKQKPMIHKDDIKQFWYYLKNSNYKVGYLINFGSFNGVQVIRRIYDTARDK